MNNEKIITVEAVMPTLGYVHHAVVGFKSTTFHTLDRGEVVVHNYELGSPRDPVCDLFDNTEWEQCYYEASQELFAAAHPSQPEAPRRRRGVAA